MPVLSVEALSDKGWHEYSHAQLGMKDFGLSGFYEDLLETFGFTVDSIAEKANQLVSFYKTRNVPDLFDRLEWNYSCQH